MLIVLTYVLQVAGIIAALVAACVLFARLTEESDR